MGLGMPASPLAPPVKSTHGKYNYAHDGRKAQSHQHKVRSAKLERRYADQKAEQTADGGCGEKCRPETKVQLHGDQAEGIGAYSQKGGVAKGELTGVTVYQVEADGHDRPDRDEKQDAGQVFTDKEREQDRHNQGQKPADTFRRKASGHGLQTSLPSSPFGRKSSMTIMMPKTKIRLYVALMYPDARLSHDPEEKRPEHGPRYAAQAAEDDCGERNKERSHAHGGHRAVPRDR